MNNKYKAVMKDNKIDWARTIANRIDTDYYEAVGILSEEMENLPMGTRIAVWDDRCNDGKVNEVEFLGVGKAVISNFKDPEKVIMIKYPNASFPTFTTFETLKEIII